MDLGQTKLEIGLDRYFKGYIYIFTYTYAYMYIYKLA